ncbi:hypothetical protein BS47DRAFT_1390033 [Hydnum rufescens UP504]|uniref:Uncharacterized protein n=1 Tax=Hydnum rufescens UP504 TaxID=1448309 RepID=A0A9P6B3W6_9AGAM|nr:hypothetical protein BS47DRAFT_1390033 [Hydnum rufescens UP504]
MPTVPRPPEKGKPRVWTLTNEAKENVHKAARIAFLRHSLPFVSSLSLHSNTGRRDDEFFYLQTHQWDHPRTLHHARFLRRHSCRYYLPLRSLHRTYPCLSGPLSHQDGTKLRSQPTLIPACPLLGSTDTMAGDDNPQSHWCQEGACPLSPIPGDYSSVGIAASFPISPPVNPWAYSGRSDYGLRTTDHNVLWLAIISPSNREASSHSADRANHFKLELNEVLRASRPLQLSYLRETQTQERQPPHTLNTGLCGRDRPIMSGLAPKREIGCCEAQGLEWGACFMRRVEELGIKRSIPECTRHECLLMLMAIDTRNRRSRSIADALKSRIKNLVESHLGRVPPGSVQSLQRMKVPQGRVRIRLVSEPDIILSTRKEG